MKQHWYKILSVLLITYTIVWGMQNTVPRLDILNETIRNVYYHVPIWFAMLFMLTVSFVNSLRLLSSSNQQYDLLASNAALTGIFFSIPGMLTGAFWAKFTWGTWWTFQDPKLNGVAVSLLIYFAYFILRSSIDDELKKARIAAVYNIFAYVMMMIFIMILPRLTDSLHPGNGGNPAFGKYDLDNQMRTVFYPAVIGWVLFSWWIYRLINRVSDLQKKLHD